MLLSRTVQVSRGDDTNDRDFTQLTRVPFSAWLRSRPHVVCLRHQGRESNPWDVRRSYSDDNHGVPRVKPTFHSPAVQNERKNERQR